ncbi:ATP-binding cassette domain-containing protein [Thiobacillus sedimenti]|uniref:ATP-binding cassette domain-containing protein n=1 Tax=Thiobacillus sedimenti TaxID=3110231 RepID=A0ABZ1CJI2_9PROT|nr:ATP-binding cassette domain-containing protein [Thiobacillus sp. SCUT-2]WRS39364.1 ATP-binding cassette domain-containing protein [Thiobacillus sp. SCUT-2]
MDDAPILEAADLAKAFAAGGRRTEALAGVSFAIRPGAITGLIGPDGAGKTTLMRLAAGLLVPDAGRIRALGLDSTRDSLAVQAALGYMPQRFGLYEDLSVQENLDLYADLQGVPKAARAARYAELMHMTGLGPFNRRLAGKLSGGMKQKLGLACTLVRAPRLLLLDEPTVGVDPVSRRELWAIVDRLVREEGMSVLLSTAYLDEAERCQAVILLSEGRILDQGPPQAISARMAGRTWAVSTPGGGPRGLQPRLAGHTGVVDALVQGDHVRVVTQAGVDAAALGALPGLEAARIEAVAPRFEDGFIDLLRPGASEAAPALAVAPLAGSAQRGADGAPVIEVDGLRRRFGSFWAVDGVSFQVRRGEIFGLLGANGAGKSTTFRMLCGLLPASGGHLRVAGLDLRHAAAAARARIGYMSQKFSLYGNLSVAQNLDFFASAYGLAAAQRAQRRDWALREFELGDHADRLSADLSLGHKQRLAMACALMHAPEILFLDEPTSGVDPLARREFWQRINALAHAGVTIMVTTHFMEEAEYCDRVAIMAAGRILAMDEPAALKAAARTAECPAPSMEDAFVRLVESAPAAEQAA